MPPRAEQSIFLSCAACGRTAAEVALRLGQPEGPDILARRDRLERTGFLGSLIHYGDYAELNRFFQLIARGDFAAARDQDPDFMGFWCRQCRRIYCDTCWRMQAPVFDEGFYDYTRAACPAGHEQIVDD